jgi:hypothetical protein
LLISLGDLADLIIDVSQLIERFYRHVIRYRPTATLFVALKSDGRAEGEPRATSGVVSPHLFRDCAGTTIAIAQPGQIRCGLSFISTEPQPSEPTIAY